jgi:hypothetical protein
MKKWSHVRRDILVALAVKAVLLVALYQLFFAPHLRPRQDPAATAAAVLGGQPEEVAK